MWALIDNNKKQLLTSKYWFSGQAFSNVAGKTAPILMLCSIFILIPLCLYTFRTLDNNRLLSWYWSISLQQVLVLLGLLSISLFFISVFAKKKRFRRNNLYYLLAIVIAAIIPLWQQPEMIIDSVRYFSQAKSLELYGLSYFLQEWGNSIFIWTDLPLIPLVYGLAFKLFGEHRVVIQILNSLLFSGTILTTYLFVKNLWGHQQALLSALLLLGIPYIYSQLPLMLVDIAAMFLLSLALLTTLLAIKHSKSKYIVMSIVTITMAMLTKYSLWLMLSVLPLLLVFYNYDNRTEKKQSIVRFIIILGGVLTLFGMVVLWKYAVFKQQLIFLLDYQWAGLARWRESNISSFFFQIHPVITLLALLSIVVAIKKRDYQFVIIAWLPLLLVIIGIQRMRYLIPILPMLAMMAAYSLNELSNPYYKRFITYGVIASAYLTALVMNNGFLQNSSAINIKAAGEYLNKMDVHLAEVLVTPQHNSVVNPIITVPTLDYYTDIKLKYGYRDYINAEQRPRGASTSSVRFTWDYVLPSFYGDTDLNNRYDKALVIIYSHQKQLESERLNRLLQNYQLEEKYQKTAGVFRYQTMVNIYKPI